MSETTPATALYPADGIAEALERISSQGLWFLLSLDHYGWRAEHDAIVYLLARLKDGADDHATEHSALIALGQVFAQVDKLWRLIYGIRAHRAGGEFTNETDGYLAGGYKLHKKIESLASLSPEEWRDLLRKELLDEEWTGSSADPENGLDSGDAEWAHLGLKQRRSGSALRPSRQESWRLQALSRAAQGARFDPEQLSAPSRVVSMWSAGVARLANARRLAHLRCICVSALIGFGSERTC